MPTSAGDASPQAPTEPATARPVTAPTAVPDTTDTPKADRYTDEEQQQITRLKARDTEVRRHEQAHKAVGGQYAGSISYDYQTGPDGKRYAIGGDVPLDVSPEDTPRATIQKMEVVIRAALAPLEPSSEDRAIAQRAQRQKAEAVSDLMAERRAVQAERLEADGTAPEQRAARAYNQQAQAVEESPSPNTDKSV